MSRTIEQLKQIKASLDKLKAHEKLKPDASFLEGEKEDLSHFNEVVKYIEAEISSFRSNFINPDFEQFIKKFLHDRWLRIANTPLCYTQNQSHPLNQFCMKLAEYLDVDTKNALLMPGVNTTDILGFELNKLQFGEFIVDDSKHNFISIESLVNTACERIRDRVTPLYVRTDARGSVISLSAAEQIRCHNVVTVINSIQTWFELRQSNIFEQLINLRNCLRQGDASHGGAEYNSGADANVGIAHFYQVYTSMREDERIRLNRFSDGRVNIGNILDRLFRPADQNYESVRFCIQTLGRQLESIINANSATLAGLNVSQSNNLNSLIEIVKQQLSGPNISVNVVRAPTMHRSQLNPDLMFSESQWIISFIAPKSFFYIPTHAKIVVEGMKDGKLFIGSYYALANTSSDKRKFAFFRNTTGFFHKIKIFESCGYAQMTKLNSTGALEINDAGIVESKFNQLEELRRSLSRSHLVPVENAVNMIKAIKNDAATTDLANWIASKEPSQVSQNHRSLFIPYEYYGSGSFFGTGKNNGVTWCEEKLAVAGCGRTSYIDSAKAKPIAHVWRT